MLTGPQAWLVRGTATAPFSLSVSMQSADDSVTRTTLVETRCTHFCFNVTMSLILPRKRGHFFAPMLCCNVKMCAMICYNTTVCPITFICSSCLVTSMMPVTKKPQWFDISPVLSTETLYKNLSMLMFSPRSPMPWMTFKAQLSDLSH
jgi:hypothetical protein